MNNHNVDHLGRLRQFWPMFGRLVREVAAVRWCAAMLAATMLSACATSGAGGGAGNGSGAGAPMAGADGGGAAAPVGAGSGWTVAVDTYRGEDAERAAEQKAALVRGVKGMENAFAERRGGVVVVGVGRYWTADGAEARAGLARVQGTTVEGQRPFAFAFMYPPAEGATGQPGRGAGGAPTGGVGSGGGVAGAGGYDLRTARSQFGEGAKYTLQIGVYGAPDYRDEPTPQQLAEARREAERAVAILRQSGEQAWFYHGPLRSMVTVGVFGDDVLTADATPEYALLRQRYPHNLYNGQGLRERLGNTEARMQPSILVKVP